MLELGNYIAYHAIQEGRHAAYTPSYGPETRGGRVRCYVVLSEGEIDSPIAEEPDIMIIMNRPSMDFVPNLKPDGLLIMNSSLIEGEAGRDDVRTVKIPATKLADDLKQQLPPATLGNLRDTRLVANSVVFGLYLALNGLGYHPQRIRALFEFFFGEKKASAIPVNLAATETGYRYGEKLLPAVTAA